MSVLHSMSLVLVVWLEHLFWFSDHNGSSCHRPWTPLPPCHPHHVCRNCHRSKNGGWALLIAILLIAVSLIATLMMIAILLITAWQYFDRHAGLLVLGVLLSGFSMPPLLKHVLGSGHGGRWP